MSEIRLTQKQLDTKTALAFTNKFRLENSTKKERSFIYLFSFLHFFKRNQLIIPAEIPVKIASTTAPK